MSCQAMVPMRGVERVCSTVVPCITKISKTEQPLAVLELSAALVYQLQPLQRL